MFMFFRNSKSRNGQENQKDESWFDNWEKKVENY